MNILKNLIKIFIASNFSFQLRHRTLEEKVSAQEAVVQQILSMGVQHLKNRLSELDMDHVTEVTELLQGYDE